MGPGACLHTVCSRWRSWPPPSSGPEFAAKLTDREHTRIEEPRPADVPSDEEMEAAGAVIGKIDIDIRNIFDEGDPRENSGLFRIADHLHIRTKRSAIQAQLLFRSGDKYSARKLAETERTLRLLTYVYDAHIVPVHYGDGKVDVRVITKDVWTLSPGISFGRAGGTNATSFKLQDTNFFGWGKSVQISHESTVDRTSDTVAWSDPNVFGSRWISAAEYDDSSDGSTRSLQIARPFYSLDAPWSVNLVGVRFDRTVSRYNLGKIVDQFSDNQTSYELSGGLSKRLDRRLDQAPDVRSPLRPQCLRPDGRRRHRQENCRPSGRWRIRSWVSTSSRMTTRKRATRIKSDAPRICTSARRSRDRWAGRTACSGRTATR